MGEVRMKQEEPLAPYLLPSTVRLYVYDSIVLAWETKQVTIIKESFSKKKLEEKCGLYVLKIDKLSELKRRDQEPWQTGEFLCFYNDGRGYECLFKRLRDTFAHGHYGLYKRGWITIRHRYKGRGDMEATTRAFGRFRTDTLKKLAKYLNKNDELKYYGDIDDFRKYTKNKFKSIF